MSDESRPGVENQPQHESPRAAQRGSGARITRREALLAAGGAVAVAAGATAAAAYQPASPTEVSETPILTDDGPVGKGWAFITRRTAAAEEPALAAAVEPIVDRYLPGVSAECT